MESGQTSVVSKRFVAGSYSITVENLVLNVVKSGNNSPSPRLFPVVGESLLQNDTESCM